MSAPLFTSVLCGTHNGPTGLAARRQADLLASPDGDVEAVPAAALIRLDREALVDRCANRDLLVIANGPGARRTLERAPLPTLLARWCPAGPAELARRILVAVDGREGAEEAADLAGRLVARFGGAITLLAASRRNAVLDRAVNASERVVLRRTAVAPDIVGRQLPTEQAIAACCALAGASLLIIGTGGEGISRTAASDIAARVGCSVLSVPVPVPVPVVRAPAIAERRRELAPA